MGSAPGMRTPEMPQQNPEMPINLDSEKLNKKRRITFTDSRGDIHNAESVREMIERIKEERENMN